MDAQAGEKFTFRTSSLTYQEYRRAWVRFARNRVAVFGLLLLAGSILLIIFGPFIYPLDPFEQDLSAVLSPPSLTHPLGTDELGRDILSRVLVGGRVSMTMGLVAVVIAMLLGTILGVFSGFIGGKADEATMRFIDILMAFPGFLLAILMLNVLGPGLYQAMVAVGLTYSPRFVRLARASTLALKESEFILAARALGQGQVAIIYYHILPNIMGPLIVQASLLIGVAILIAASLGFLGFGIRPPAAEWGNMLSTGRDYLTISPYVVISPGIAILIVVLAFNLIGDGLRDMLDVRST